MLERLRALGQQRADTTATPEPDTFQGAPTTVEPLPPADALVPEDHRPTIREIPADVRDMIRGRADRIAAGAVSSTSKLERVPQESTPAPLPPSPEAEQAAASWFESVPTSPSVPPDMGRFAQGHDTGTGGSVITPLHQRAGANIGYQPTRPLTRPKRPRAGTVIAEKPWAIPALIAATSLTVGMVLGALIFGGGDSPAATPSADAGVCAPCPEPPATAPAPTDEPPAPAKGQHPKPTRPGSR